MAITNFSVRNFKAFAARAEVRVKPLTLIFGYNSAGKSALVRWLPLLTDSLNQATKSPLDLTSLAARGARFADMLSKYTASPTLEFQVTTPDGRLRFVLRDVADQRRQIVELIELRSPLDEVERLEWLASPTEEAAYKLTVEGVERQVDVYFSGLFPDTQAAHRREVRDFAGRAKALFADAVGNTHWLQAIRAVPPRKEVFSGAVRRVAPDGTGITQLLYAADSLGSDVIKAVSSWYQSATGFNLSIQRGAFGSAELFSFCLESSGLADRPIEMADTGEGMGQVLPIVGLLALAQRGELGPDPLLLFEHPELHLHRAAEPALAELLCQTASQKSARIIAETHSESLLLAVQLNLIAGALKPEDVVVYWVRQSEGSPATVNEISFDELGRPVGGEWPPGVFMENAEQARQVVRARRAKETDAH